VYEEEVEFVTLHSACPSKKEVKMPTKNPLVEPGLSDLKEASRKLKSLLDDPQPGFSTWCMFLADNLNDIAAFAPGYMKVDK
jgi:hypothetical protein